MTKEDNIIIPRSFLEVIEDTLRIQNNINLDKKTGETCQDRNVKQSLNIVRKLLRGQEITGMERLEKLQPSLPSNLDEAAEEYGRKEYSHAIHFWDEGLSKNKPEVMKEDFVDAFKAGAEWLAGQGISVEGKVIMDFSDPDDIINRRLIAKLSDALLKVCTFLFKPDAFLGYTADETPEYVGLSIPNEFVVGYGLDYKDLGRNLDKVYKLD